MKNIVSNTATAVLVMCAMTITALLVRRELLPQRQRAPQPLTLEAVHGPPLGAMNGHSFGGKYPRLRIVEFSDFQCPFCASAVPTLRAIIGRDSESVAVVYRHLPLRAIHPFAYEAALASECAADQGRFESYHNLLFAKQDSIGHLSWSEFARRSKVGDAERFATCVRLREHRTDVERDIAAAVQAGINGTPTFIVNDTMISGTQVFQHLEQRVDALRGGGRKLALDAKRLR